MRTNFVLKSPDELMAVLKKMEAAYPDWVFITGVTTGGTVSAPTKKRSHYQHELKHAFAPECFEDNGVSALMSGGGFYIAHVPRENVNPDLLKDKEASSDEGTSDRQA